MNLSELGNIAEKFWKEIPNHFPCIVLDAFIVMPNHIHGILTIDKKFCLPGHVRPDRLWNDENVYCDNAVTGRDVAL